MLCKKAKEKKKGDVFNLVFILQVWLDLQKMLHMFLKKKGDVVYLMDQ